MARATAIQNPVTGFLRDVMAAVRPVEESFATRQILASSTNLLLLPTANTAESRYWRIEGFRK
jgi:hypothetical protein